MRRFDINDIYDKLGAKWAVSAAKARILDARETVIYLNNYFWIHVCAKGRARSTDFVHKLIINFSFSLSLLSPPAASFWFIFIAAVSFFLPLSS